MIVLELGTTTIRTHEAKTTEAVHQNIKDKLINYNLQMKQVQILHVLTIQKLQNYS